MRLFFKGTPGALDTPLHQGSERAATAPAKNLRPGQALACVRHFLPSTWQFEGEYPQKIGKSHGPPKVLLTFSSSSPAMQSLFGRLLVHYRRLKSGID